MSVKLGLTGSIGMGKSTTAAMFADLGCAVWDADAAVHRLYQKGGHAVEPLSLAFPAAIEDGAVSRPTLKSIITKTPSALTEIERIVHPLVAADREDFLHKAEADIVVFDIPLLFETGGDASMDKVAVVFVEDHVQRARVLARGTMNAAQFEAIKAKQMDAADKCERADYVIPTDTLEGARAAVHSIVEEIRAGQAHA